MAVKPKTEGFYSPSSEAAAVPLTRGQKAAATRAANLAKIEPGVDKRATAAGQPGAEALARNAAGTDPMPQRSALAAMTGVDVDPKNPGLTADATFAEGAPDERQQLIADTARIRSLRKPFGAFTQKLALDVRAGYKRHWFSDEPGRVDEAIGNGWAHVNDKEGKPVRRVVGRGRDGGAMYGYAMELPKVFWDEDMQAKNDAAQARIDEIKKNPFRAKPGQAKASDADKFYSAREEPVQMTQTSVRSAPSGQ